MANLVTAEDKARAVELWTDIQLKATDVTKQVQHLMKKVEGGEINTAKGISFLEVKYQVLVGYLTDLSYLMCHKARGKSIQANPAVDRLVEMRTVLEKMRPIDQKLKYQIDKLVKSATTGASGANDPLRFKPNPENLVSKLEEGGAESGSDTEERPSTSAIYRPPKLAAVHYEGDETEQDRRERQMARAKKRAISSSIMADLREELDKDRPREIRDNIDMHRGKQHRAEKERIEYEEETFVRMSVSKKERNAAKRMRTMSALNDVTKFGEISALTGGDLGDDETPRKKRKTGHKGKGKKKKGSKRRKTF